MMDTVSIPTLHAVWECWEWKRGCGNWEDSSRSNLFQVEALFFVSRFPFQSRLPLADDAFSDGVKNQLGNAVKIELLQDVSAMRVHGVDA